MLVLRPGALGDTLLAVPALRALRRRFGPVTLAAHADAARLLAALGEVDRGLAFDDPRLGWIFTGALTPALSRTEWGPGAEARRKRALGAEAEWERGCEIVAWLSGPPPRGLRGARVVAPGRPPDETHCARYLLQTLVPLGVDAARLDDHQLAVSPLPSDEVLVHPGSGSAAKNWPAERFALTVRALQRPVRLIVGEADAPAAEALEAALGHALPRLRQPDLAELAARLAGCHAYVGNDSGVSHLAGLCGARCVVLFGPTSPRVWRPLGPRVRVVAFDTDPLHVASALRT